MESEKDSRTLRDKALFNEIAESYSAKDLASACRPARRMRLVQTMAVCQRDWQFKPDILEVGCGTGYSAQYLEGLYGSYTGIDYSEMLIKQAGKIHQQENVHFEACDFHDFAPGKQFDIIVMIGVLHHMVEIDNVLSKCREMLKPGGYLVANEPQPGNPVVQGLRKIRTKVDTSYSDEQEFLSAEYLRDMYSQAGFTAIRTVPQGYFSTPFAEVILRPQAVFSLLSKTACALDRVLESGTGKLLGRMSWNVIACGRAPD